ncbi:MAG: alpha/beta hydrolase-fold protein [Prolixibacteraceae bacterium]|nr:alpha/beta hydrolase-fold protein [Prolixibacteraceae bacterium]
MKKYIAGLFILLFYGTILAQQNTGFRQGNITSPQINNDNTVTFRLNAPLAQIVILAGDWEANSGKGEMKKDTAGIWSFTTVVLPSDIYNYKFIVDDVPLLDPCNPFQCRDVGSLFSTFIVSKGRGDYYKVNDVAHGNVIRTWYHSNVFQKDRRLTIYTPPGYEDSKKKYPVLYLLHGSGGDEEAWINSGCLARIMDNLIAEGKANPMVVVMPNGNPSKQAAPGETKDNFDYRPAMSNTFPGYKEGKYEMSFKEIIDFTDSHYNTIPEKSKRAIAGLSMGGFHTMYISANLPETFDYIGLFSPGLNFSGINTSISTYANLDDKLLMFNKLGKKIYWIGVGKEDGLYDAIKNYRSRLDSLKIPYTYLESTRGHIWANWRAYMLDFVPQLF